MNEPCLIVRYSETTLKGGNRSFFEKRMAENIAAHLKSQGRFALRRERARMTILGKGGPDGDLELAADIVRGLPGVANVSLARPVPAEIEALCVAVTGYLEEWLERDPPRPGMTLSGGPGDESFPEAPITFKMEVSRKDKRYPLNSMEVAARLGQAALERFPFLKVNLTAPERVVQVEIHGDSALLSTGKIPGPGGLAVGTSGRAVCLLSGGIDSPVAAWMMMTRGVRVSFLNFHSHPFIGEQSKEKVYDLTRVLACHQPRTRLFVAPFAEAQTAIRDNCPPGLRTILYRRLMNRVANEVAKRERAGAIITGESLGQVASQTLPNIAAIAETARIPVLQPLIGLGKGDIVDKARALGTYDISIRPYPDCCTLFQPNHPETRARPEAVHTAESDLDTEPLLTRIMAGLEIKDYGPEYFPTGWGS